MTGELLAVMDGRYITEARTAAVSAVSVKLLARERADTLAVIGSGVQARSHLDAIGRVRPLRRVRVWSPNPDSRSAFAREMHPRTTAAITVCTSARDALDDADLVVLATAAREPVVRSEWIADGAHICAVGACRPDQREMDSALVSRGRLFVDSRTAALTEAGDVLLAMKDGPVSIAGELGELAAGRVTGRASAEEVTIFKSLGMAVEDVAAAHLAFVKAAERGLGQGVCYLRKDAVSLASAPFRPALLHHLGDALARFGRHLAALPLLPGLGAGGCARAADGGGRGRRPDSGLLAELCRLSGQRGEPFLRLADFTFETADRPADQLGRLHQHVLVLSRSPWGHANPP